MGEHGAQPLAVRDPARKIAKLVLDAGELAEQSVSAWPGRAITYSFANRRVTGSAMPAKFSR
jgi:hypothetical protein